MTIHQINEFLNYDFFVWTYLIGFAYVYYYVMQFVLGRHPAAATTLLTVVNRETLATIFEEPVAPDPVIENEFAVETLPAEKPMPTVKELHEFIRENDLGFRVTALVGVHYSKARKAELMKAISSPFL